MRWRGFAVRMYRHFVGFIKIMDVVERLIVCCFVANLYKLIRRLFLVVHLKMFCFTTNDLLILMYNNYLLKH